MLGSYYTIPEYYGSFYHDFNSSDASAVSFYWSSGFHLSSSLNMWISSPVDHTITLIQASTYTAPKATLILVAGALGQTGYRDGDLSTSLLNTPRSAYEYQNMVYVADTENHCIRVIDTQVKSIKQFAGTCQSPGFMDGPPQYNLLTRPDLVGVNNGTLFINDSGNNYIRMVNLTTQYMVTLLGGACRDAVNITGNYTAPDYNYQDSVFYFQGLNVHTIVCVTGMVKTEGEPSGHIFNPENYPQPCVEHITLCENRTSPYVIRNYTG